MRNFIIILAATLSLLTYVSEAQVQVRNEPRHKNVFENKYLRILDVNIPPGDTTQFHIHSTPSIFLIFTNTITGAQIKGKEWGKGQNIAGSASYRSFINDTLVHRVSNWDTTPFHVNDIEILSSYGQGEKNQLLLFTLLFENEKVAAYRLTDASFNEKVIAGRGPMVAALVEGNPITIHNTKTKKTFNIKAGSYQYIEPGSSFYLSPSKGGNINLVLFEIK